jgi:hypothetical protein
VVDNWENMIEFKNLNIDIPVNKESKEVRFWRFLFNASKHCKDTGIEKQNMWKMIITKFPKVIDGIFCVCFGMKDLLDLNKESVQQIKWMQDNWNNK